MSPGIYLVTKSRFEFTVVAESAELAELAEPKNSFEVLKLLENSVEVLKILENKLESMKILENKLASLKLQENQPVDGLVPLSIKKLHPKVSSRGC
nr:hypothetical protein [Tanacetum cinerariifolium]